MERCTSLPAAAVAAVIAVLAAQPAAAMTFGIGAHVPSARIQDEIVDGGIGWARIDVVWGLIEIHRDTFYWDRYDQLIDDLEARGIRIYATIQGTPQWATSGPEFNGVPDDPADFKEFCYIAASRYRGRIDAWGFWNEPNLEHFWTGSRTEYIEDVLLPGIEAVAAADPNALLVAADLAHLSSGHWDDWLGRVIADAGDLLDVIAHHVYPSNGTSGDVTDKLAEGGQYPWDPPSVRDVLDGAGWGDRPFWLTETGVESEDYGEDGQAAFYEGLVERWFGPTRDHDWIDRVFFYEMADPPDLVYSFGILGPPPGLERKQAFYAYRAVIETATVDDAEITVSGMPAFLGGFTTFEPVYTVHNTGTTSWTAADGYRLTIDIEELGWQQTVEELPSDRVVAPGEAVTLRATIRSGAGGPTTPPRTVPVRARMVGATDSFGTGSLEHVVITGGEPPIVTRDPSFAQVPFNGAALFSIEVADPGDVSFRWRRNTVALFDDHRHRGTTTAELALSGVAYDSVGDYDCVVTSPSGTVVSSPAGLALVGPPLRRPDARRAVAAAASQALERWLDFRAQRPTERLAPLPPARQPPYRHETQRR